MMDVDMEQQATHLCGYSDVSSADTFPNTGQNTNGEIGQGSEQPMEWHSDVNDPHLNYSEGVESMKWQEGGGPQDNVSVLEPQSDNRQLLEYCHSDVDILLNVCWKFRKLFMDIMGPHHPIDPFDYITIASLCMGTFHVKFFYLRNGWCCTRRMQETTACIGYGTASVHGSRPENCRVMHPSNSTWGMEAGQKWTGMR